MYESLYILIGLAVGAAAVWIILKSKIASLRDSLEQKERDFTDEKQAAERKLSEEMQTAERKFIDDKQSMELNFRDEKSELERKFNEEMLRAKEDFNAIRLPLEKEKSSLNQAVEEIRTQIEIKDNKIDEVSAKFEEVSQLKTELETRLEETKKNLDQQRELLEDANKKLKDTFESLSSTALKSNNQAFMDLAKSELSKFVTDAKGDFDKKQSLISKSLEPISETLTKYEQNIKDIELAREKAYSGLSTHLEWMKESSENLRKETVSLVSALKSTKQRGKYGEIGLRRVVEFAGLNEHCDFHEQTSVTTDEGRLIPDLTIHLPGEHDIIVDSKLPFDSYYKTFETDNVDEKKMYLSQHARAVKNHIKSLSSKNYWSQFKNAPDFVVLYIHFESAFGAALEFDNSLIEEGMKNRIILATPTNLIALLHTVAYSWKQDKISKDSQKIYDEAEELYKRLHVLVTHISKIGPALSKASDSYNKAIGSLERSYIPQAKRMHEMGGNKSAKELPELPQSNSYVREAPELKLDFE